MSGIGSLSPTISKDAILTAHFLCSNHLESFWTQEFTVSLGIVPDSTFPADVTLGQTLFHELGLRCLSDGKLQLLNLIEQPILNPIINTLPTRKVFTTSNIPTVKWHPATTHSAFQFSLEYQVKFPSLFDKSLRQMDKISKIEHRIETGNCVTTCCRVDRDRRSSSVWKGQMVNTIEVESR